MISGWGSGKTLFAILRGMDLSQEIPENLGLFVRKEYTDLRDSTIKDFEKYTGLRLDANKEVRFPNGSMIMFRHGAELDVLKNINLGWFCIEQAEEFESEEQFEFLRGRLRRAKVKFHTGFIIANANGQNWIWKLWISNPKEEFEVFTATTFDNADNLPKDFIEDLKRMELEAPEQYRRFVLNDFSVSDDQFLIIKSRWFEELKKVIFPSHSAKKIVACDPSLGGDECVIYVMENSKIIDEKILHENNTMIIAGEILAFLRKYEINDVAIDIIGIGKGIADRLQEWKINITEIDSAEKAEQQDLFYNKRAEIWFYTSQQIINKNIEYPIDEELRRQLSNVRYKVLDSNGKIKLEPKQDTKERLGRSPDRADAFVYGLWGLKNVTEFNPYQQTNIDFDKVFSGGRAGY